METKILSGGRINGKSWAQLIANFQRWLVTSFPPDSMPDSETCLLMWAAWQKSHEITKTALRNIEPDMEPIFWYEDAQ